MNALYALWRLEHPRDPEPRDPFDSMRYDIYSSGSERDDVKARLHVTSGERPQ